MRSADGAVLGATSAPAAALRPPSVPLRGGTHNERAPVPRGGVQGKERPTVPTRRGQVRELPGPLPLLGKWLPGEE